MASMETLAVANLDSENSVPPISSDTAGDFM